MLYLFGVKINLEDKVEFVELNSKYTFLLWPAQMTPQGKGRSLGQRSALDTSGGRFQHRYPPSLTIRDCSTQKCKGGSSPPQNSTVSKCKIIVVPWAFILFLCNVQNWDPSGMREGRHPWEPQGPRERWFWRWETTMMLEAVVKMLLRQCSCTELSRNLLNYTVTGAGETCKGAVYIDCRPSSGKKWTPSHLFKGYGNEVLWDGSGNNNYWASTVCHSLPLIYPSKQLWAVGSISPSFQESERGSG